MISSQPTSDRLALSGLPSGLPRHSLGTVPIVDQISELPTNRKQIVGKQKTDKALDDVRIARRPEP